MGAFWAPLGPPGPPLAAPWAPRRLKKHEKTKQNTKSIVFYVVFVESCLKFLGLAEVFA